MLKVKAEAKRILNLYNFLIGSRVLNLIISNSIPKTSTVIPW